MAQHYWLLQYWFTLVTTRKYDDPCVQYTAHSMCVHYPHEYMPYQVLSGKLQVLAELRMYTNKLYNFSTYTVHTITFLAFVFHRHKKLCWPQSLQR